MDKAEALALLARCLPERLAAAGLPASHSDVDVVRVKSIASLWAGMGNVYEITLKTRSAPSSSEQFSLIAKRVNCPEHCTSVGDKRKKDSYQCEAAFYERGHAERLLAKGAMVPRPLYVDNERRGGVTICMTRVEEGSAREDPRSSSRAFVSWLAKLHAEYWGAKADEACSGAGGLQAQGCYWHLDTRLEEHTAMNETGWMGRLKLAARAIDLRLKADPFQSVCHGDAKGANIVYDKDVVPFVYDFQYCGKAAVTKDLAYFFNVDVCFENLEEERYLLEQYRGELVELLKKQGDIVEVGKESLETSLELALCDWRRFTEVGLGGWGESVRATKRVIAVLDRLDGGRALASEQKYVEAVWREFPV